MTVWHDIEVAVRLIDKGTVERVDGDCWKVYRAGTIIRIDLSAEFLLPELAA